MGPIALIRSAFARLFGKPAVIEATVKQEGASETRTLTLPAAGPVDGALVALRGEGRTLAPYPIVDKYPLLQGQQLSLQSLANAYRLALSGYRQVYVDILDEILEREPHGFAVLTQRILPVACARMEIEPAVSEGDPRYARAKEIANDVGDQIRGLPRLREHFARLLWGLYYGVAASEIRWGREGQRWVSRDLTFVHSRRLNYPDPFTWDLHIWDQGLVGPTGSFPQPTSAPPWGIRVSDYPNKFVVHTAQVRGDYPTRDGLGRELGDWFLLKRIAARGAAQYLERFSKPWAIGTYNTADPSARSSGPRVAETEDITQAMAAIEALGLGSLASYMAPDCIKIDLKTPDGGTGGAGKIGYLEFLGYCDQQISKCVLVQTLTTDIGSSGGNRALGQVHERKASEIARYDAACLAETLKRDLAGAIVRLNWPEDVDLIPNITLHVEDPEADAIVAIAHKAAEIGMPIDAEDVAHKIGLKLAADGAKRLAFVKPVDLFSIDDTIEPPPQPKQPTAEENTAASDDSEDEAGDEPSAEPAKH